ncbi:hypothetical protein DOTSEDRAFT_44940 [Dothistroma septosporum NZE10]|uniref:Uncharacterized protein n=1 Tax=Dothistroma septosporum (strain NZE10 / CBS 128990) TaxID=675120 RepID=M2Y3D4_DOTSN|nr:hypothetical protein DOTSEDRAFT_44940 [Dothistroma septosporum NZE10]
MERAACELGGFQCDVHIPNELALEVPYLVNVLARLLNRVAVLRYNGAKPLSDRKARLLDVFVVAFLPRLVRDPNLGLVVVR